MKDFFPKTLYPLHIFEEDEVFYAADLEKARVVELSVVMAKMLLIVDFTIKAVLKFGQFRNRELYV